VIAAKAAAYDKLSRVSGHPSPKSNSKEGPMQTPISRLSFVKFVAIFLTLLTSPLLAHAQIDDVEKLKADGAALVSKQRYTEALPIYEKLAKLAPKDPVVFRNLGFSLLGQSTNVEDADTKRQLRVRARDAFVLARDFGDDSLLVKGMIEGLPADGSGGTGYSDNAEANKLMNKAEAFFSQGKSDEAFAAYQSALALDPHCYYAALFSGDVKTQTGKFDEAEKWYQKAIEIDPNIETAYRYSATPLMRQGKTELARDRYIESYITAPYDKLAISGIVQWADVTKTRIGHPKLAIPETGTGVDGKTTTNITVSPDDDGSIAWLSYTATREEWQKEKFAKTYPKQAYRHTLAEDADALRSVVKMAKGLKTKTLNPQLALLSQMDADGVLESYILLAQADRDIAGEHRRYLIANRPKLRLYVSKYVIGQEK